MWILPKNLSLPVSSGSTDTVEMLSDLNEQSQACALSLSVRGTPSSLRTWSAKWKRDSWTQYLSGRMLRTSPASLSAISGWISSQLPTPVKGSATPVNASESKTTATSGPIAESSSELFGLDGSGLKTSRDTFRLDSPQSSLTWKKMVIQRRGEYSARLKSERLTSGKECLSWPTTSAGDWKGGCATEKNGTGVWNQFSLPDAVKSGPPAPANDNTPGSRRESWATPRSGATDNSRPNGQGGKCLGAQVKESWATPMVGMGENSHGQMSGQFRREMNKVTGTVNAKLNPRWVETLMGLPMGWTSPDAPASLIANWKRFTDGWLKAQTAQTNSECAETESCPKPQNELSEFYIENLLDFELESLGLL